MSEKPLYVRVAEALGWQDIENCGGLMIPQASHHCGRPPGQVVIIGKPEEGRKRIPRYDLDWSVTGPLIERLDVSFGRGGAEGAEVFAWIGRITFANDVAVEANVDWTLATGPTRLVAVCNVILAMHAAGKLESP